MVLNLSSVVGGVGAKHAIDFPQAFGSRCGSSVRFDISVKCSAQDVRDVLGSRFRASVWLKVFGQVAGSGVVLSALKFLF